jgi:hypothetical protein
MKSDEVTFITLIKWISMSALVRVSELPLALA